MVYYSDDLLNIRKVRSVGMRSLIRASNMEVSVDTTNMLKTITVSQVKVPYLVLKVTIELTEPGFNSS